MEIINDYVKICFWKGQLNAVSYQSEDVEYELGLISYHPSGYKYIICERNKIDEGKKKLLEPMIKERQEKIELLQSELNVLLSL